MKFIAGLLVGAIATLVVSSLATFRWEPPSRLVVAAPSSLEPVVELGPNVVTPKPIRSVTIDPLPTPAPAPVVQRRPLPEAKPVRLLVPEPSFAIEDMPISPQAGRSDTHAAVETVVETAVVWKPFHSEVSATGFARRLSTQLGYPFRALREGPARYHVVFDYDTVQQRELLQQQVTALTGFDAI